MLYRQPKNNIVSYSIVVNFADLRLYNCIQKRNYVLFLTLFKSGAV